MDTPRSSSQHSLRPLAPGVSAGPPCSGWLAPPSQAASLWPTGSEGSGASLSGCSSWGHCWHSLVAWFLRPFPTWHPILQGSKCPRGRPGPLHPKPIQHSGPFLGALQSSGTSLLNNKQRPVCSTRCHEVAAGPEALGAREHQQCLGALAAQAPQVSLSSLAVPGVKQWQARAQHAPWAQAPALRQKEKGGL